jgi:hypothetical protein
MRKPILVSLTLGAVLCGAGLALASPDVPLRFAARNLDRGLVTVENPVNGRTIAAWSFRVGRQYDLALSIRDAGSTVWSEPQIFGAADAFQQEQPALAVDVAGNVYVAYAVRETGQIMLTTLREGADAFAAPIPVTTGTGRRGNPALRIVGARLIVAYRIGASIQIADLPLLAPEQIRGNIGGEGPDTLPGGTSTNSPPPPPSGSHDDGWTRR